MAKELIHIDGEKLLLFGGVYSNYQALKALKSYADTNGFSPNQIVCTGDVVAYCAEAKECVELMMQWKPNCIAGNVEIQLRNGDDDCGCNFNDESSCDLLSRQWYPFAQQSLNASHIQWMEQLPEHLTVSFGGKRWGVVHGSHKETAEFIYKSSPWQDKADSLNALAVDHILAGHCGIPFIDQQDENAWINSGALGMPANDGTNRVWFCVIEKQEESFSIAFHTIEYAIDVAQEKMKSAGLPDVYRKTLETGIWHSTEVLRDTEAALTGKAIAIETVSI